MSTRLVYYGSTGADDVFSKETVLFRTWHAPYALVRTHQDAFASNGTEKSRGFWKSRHHFEPLPRHSSSPSSS